MFKHEKKRKILHVLKIWHLSENFWTHPRTQHTNLNLALRNNKIELVRALKFLAVYIDKYLSSFLVSSCPHVKYLSSKLQCCLGATKRIRPFLNQKSLLTLISFFF